MFYRSPKIGVFIQLEKPEAWAGGARVWDRGPEQILDGHEQILDHYEQKVIGYQQVHTGELDQDGQPEYENGDPIYGDDHDRPVYRDGEPIYSYGPTQYELVGWQEAWGAPPTEEEVEAYTPPPPQESNVSAIDMTKVFVDAREKATLFLDEIKKNVWEYLVVKGNEPANATKLGVALCDSRTGIGLEYDDFVKNGGHPDAAAKLYQRVLAVRKDLAWLDDGVIEIFKESLGG